jgi:hypothetical protein
MIMVIVAYYKAQSKFFKDVMMISKVGVTEDTPTLNPRFAKDDADRNLFTW